MYSQPLLVLTPAPISPISSSIRSQQYIYFFNNFLLFLFPPSCCFSQTIIPNLTSYSIYIVYVQAASLSTYKPHRMLLGSHSASRKVNLMCFFAPLFCVFHSSSWWSEGVGKFMWVFCELWECHCYCCCALCRVLHSWGILLDSRRMRISGIGMEWRR